MTLSPPLSRITKITGCYTLFLALLMCASGTLAGSRLVVGGSGADLGTFQLLAAAFSAQHPEVTIDVPQSLGSSAAVKGILTGLLDIGLTSRPLREGERNKGVREILYAKTPLVFVTSARDRHDNITRALLIDFYAGSRSTWPDGEPVRVILRPPLDSDIQLLRSDSVNMKRALEHAYQRRGIPIAMTDQEAADMVTYTPGGLSSSTLALVRGERRRLKVLSLEGVVPGPETIADGSYPYYKPLYMVVGEQLDPLAQAFIDFVFTEPARKILRDSGHLLLDEEARR